jgi:two-component system response regulator AtoC
MTTGDAETVRSDEGDKVSGEAGRTVLALYVTSPGGGARHVLPEGLVSLGRDAESTIVVDDPRVSRFHAVLHVAEGITLSDLGSANGTSLGDERLAQNEPRPVSLGQTFFVGDSALVIRATSLPRSCPKRVNGWDAVRDRFARLDSKDGDSPHGHGPHMVVARVRAVGRAQPRAWEPILGEILASPHDWMMWVGRDHLVLGIEAQTEADAVRVERLIVDRLAAWSATADVESRFVSNEELDADCGGLRTLLPIAETPLLVRDGQVVLRDPAMRALKRTVMRVAPAPVNVLILGETGAGKEVFAGLVHQLSPRAKGPFVGLNCASLPESLLESELFGYERGAFTGAVTAKPGLLESGDGGTVFLDEIGDISAQLQAKLLRAIELHEVMRLGGIRPCSIDIRFIAATNRDLAGAVEAGGFRRDLYYRLNTVTLTVPPLRDRPTEIEPLAQLFLEQACTRFGLQALRLSPAALAALSRHSWPGNIRELRNVILRATLLASGSTIEPVHLDLPRRAPAIASPTSSSSREATIVPPSQAAVQTPELVSERERIERALQAHGWNQTRAAKSLGVPRRTLVRQIARHRLPRPRDRSA